MTRMNENDVVFCVYQDGGRHLVSIFIKTLGCIVLIPAVTCGIGAMMRFVCTYLYL